MGSREAILVDILPVVAAVIALQLRLQGGKVVAVLLAEEQELTAQLTRAAVVVVMAAIAAVIKLRAAVGLCLFATRCN